MPQNESAHVIENLGEDQPMLAKRVASTTGDIHRLRLAKLVA
jgi:hypothetical protein